MDDSKQRHGPECAGFRVAKYFLDDDGSYKLYRGVAAEFHPAQTNDCKEDLWLIRYEDGDKEHMYLKELIEHIGLYNMTATRDVDVEDSLSKKRPAKEELRVLVVFNMVPYFGTVMSEDDATVIVRFDDGKHKIVDRCNLSYVAKKKKPKPNQSKRNKPSSNKKVARGQKREKSLKLFKIHKLSVTTGKEQIETLLGEDLSGCAEEVAHFFLYCYERQLIWKRRQIGSEPLTDDPLLANHSFCNNMRELDRGTCYFRSQVLNLWEQSTKDGPISRRDWIGKVLWGACCYRLLNRVETFEAFGCIPTRDKWKPFQITVRRLKEGGTTVFSGGHQNGGLMAYENLMSFLSTTGKLDATAGKVHSAAIQNNLKGCFDAVHALPGAGPFFAWQIVCDMLESQCLSPCTDEDWAQLGPGAESGIHLIFEKATTRKATLDLAKKLRDIQDGVYRALGIQFPQVQGNKLSLKTIEHALCEFSKYVNLTKLRHFRSQSESDFEKRCRVCKENAEEKVFFCDFCLEAYCTSCIPLPEGTDDPSWKCPRCTKFESMEFSNE